MNMNKNMAKMMEAMMGGQQEEETKSNIASAKDRDSLEWHVKDTLTATYNGPA